MRAVSAVIAGSLAMGAILFALPMVAFFALGADRVFRGDSFEISSSWVVVSFVVSVGAAVAGGWLCAVVGESPKLVLALAAFVLLIGADGARKQLAPSPRYSWMPAKRSGDELYFQVMKQARFPPWAAILIPLTEGVGVMLGGRLKRTAACHGAEGRTDAGSAPESPPVRAEEQPIG